MSDIKVGSRVSWRGTPGIRNEGVVMRVDKKNAEAGVMWRIDGGIMSQSEKIKNLMVIEAPNED